MSYFLQFNLTESQSGQDIVIRTVQERDTCLCCLARNVKLVSLAKCKHTSFFEFFFKFKFQYQNSVICYKCHYLLYKIELFKYQIEECLGIFWNEQTPPESLTKKFENLVCSETYIEDNLDEGIEPASNYVNDIFVYEVKPVVEVKPEIEPVIVDEFSIENADTEKAEYDLITEIKIEDVFETTPMLENEERHNNQDLCERKKCQRPKRLDIVAILEFMESHGDLERYKGDNADKLWKDLTKLLNSSNNNKVTVDSVKEEWSDWKNEMKMKASQILMSSKIFSPLEERMLAIIGHDFLELPEIKEEELDSSKQSSEPLNSTVLEPESNFTGMTELCEEESISEESSCAGVESKLNTKETKLRPISKVKSSETIEMERLKGSYIQFATMLKFMERHGDLAVLCPGNKVQARKRADRLWTILTKKLNSLDGCAKNVDKWKKVWADWKSKTKKKVTLARRTSGPRCGVPSMISCTEERVLAVMGRGRKKPIPSPVASKPLDSVKLDPELDTSCNELMKDETHSSATLELLKDVHMASRCRSGSRQFTTILKFMERHGDLSAWRDFPGLRKAERLWVELTDKLNSIGDQTKTLEQWKRVWIDWKSNTKKKSLKLQKQPGPVRFRLSPLEARVCAVSGRPVVDDDPVLSEVGCSGPSQSAVTENPSSTFHLEFETNSSDGEPIPTEVSASGAMLKEGEMEYRSRANAKQLNMIVDFIERHANLPRLSRKHRSMCTEFWVDLARMLNSVDGDNKSVKKWKKVWADLKSKTKKKLVTIRRTGGNSSLYLSPIEERVRAIIDNETARMIAEQEFYDLPSQSQSSAASNSSSLPNLESELSDHNEMEEGTSLPEEKKKNNEKTRGNECRYRISFKQLSVMEEFFERHGDPALWPASHGREKAEQLWGELTRKLNSKRGCRKTRDKWEKVWINWKCKARRKAFNIKHSLKGGGPEGRSLTSLEERVLAIIDRFEAERKPDPGDSDVEEGLEDSSPPQSAAVSESARAFHLEFESDLSD